MGYTCFINEGFIRTDSPEDVCNVLSDLLLEGYVREDGVDICPDTLKYHEEDYEELAKYAKPGSYIRFIGEDDAVWTLYPENGKIRESCGEIIYDSDELNKLCIPLDNGYSLVAERNSDSDYKELFVYLEKDGMATQDLVIVGEQYTYDDDDNVVPIHGAYSVKVYSDPESEDYNCDFGIGRWEGSL